MRQLLSEMDSEEVSEWMAFDQLEPLPDVSWSSGMVAATMCNLWGKRTKPFKPNDFMPVYRQTKTHSPEQDMALLDAMIARQPLQKL